jgi:hypothetical protein
VSWTDFARTHDLQHDRQKAVLGDIWNKPNQAFAAVTLQESAGPPILPEATSERPSTSSYNSGWSAELMGGGVVANDPPSHAWWLQGMPVPHSQVLKTG